MGSSPAAGGQEKVASAIRPPEFFEHHDAHPIVLDTLMVTAFGKDWWSWDHEALYESISYHFGPQLTKGGTVGISELTRNKLQAIRTLHGSDGFWKSWNVFTVVLQPLVNNIPDFAVLQEPTTAQLLAGVDIANQAVDKPFSAEVASYVAACCLSDGVWYLPAPLEFAQERASRPMYRCPDCGNEDEDDLSDGTCDQCSRRFEGKLNLKTEPDSPAARLGQGKNIERFLLNDPEPVRIRYDQVAGMPLEEVDLKETQVDICVARLLIARDYMNLRRQQMIEQMEVIRPWLLAH